MSDAAPALPAAVRAPKRVLVVEYSQSGQLSAVLRHIVDELRADAAIAVHVESLRPEPAYPFPWPVLRFFDAFPESAHLVAPQLAPLGLRGDEDFDLVILPWQPWFLAPSLPVTGFLKHPLAARLLAGKPVVGVVACRNMWMTAHLKVCAMLDAIGARLIDNVVLTDPGPTLATFITTPRWLLTGRREAFWGLPRAGLAEAQIAGARRFGRALRDGLLHDRERAHAPMLNGLGAVRAEPKLWIGERVGTRSFFLWGALLRAVGAPGQRRRVPLLALYAAFLVAMILTVMPLSLGLQALLRPLFGRQMQALRTRFESPSGSATDLIALYE